MIFRLIHNLVAVCFILSGVSCQTNSIRGLPTNTIIVGQKLRLPEVAPSSIAGMRLELMFTAETRFRTRNDAMELPDLPPIGVWQTWKQTPEGDIHPFGKAYCFSGYGEGRTDIGIFYTYYKTGVNTAEVHSKDASREVGQRVRLDFKTPTAGVASVSSQARNSSSQFQGLRFKLTPINSNSPGETMHRLSRDEIRLPYDAEK